MNGTISLLTVHCTLPTHTRTKEKRPMIRIKYLLLLSGDAKTTHFTITKISEAISMHAHLNARKHAHTPLGVEPLSADEDAHSIIYIVR